MIDRYLEALAVNDPAGLPMRPDVSFTENGQPLALGKGLWATASGIPDDDYAYIEDDDLGAIGWIGVIGEGGRPAVVFVRLRVQDGLIAEIETIVRREQPQLYDPSNMREPRAIVFERLAPSERRSRSELVDIGNRYFDAIERLDPELVAVTDDCLRIENGTQTVLVPDVSHLAGSTAAITFPLSVRGQIDVGYVAYIDEIRDRRVVAVDESRGLVMLVVVFDHSARMRTVAVKGVGDVELPKRYQSPASALIADLFKVRGGQIEHIEAVLEIVPYGARTGWEG
jgi:hypothetical protein